MVVTKKLVVPNDLSSSENYVGSLKGPTKFGYLCFSKYLSITISKYLSYKGKQCFMFIQFNL